MKKALFELALLCAVVSAGAQNLVMNGNFKMGTMGFAQQRALRFDTNPGQKYIPIETVKLPDGGFALKITSPYTESSTISTRQFPLKNKTKYTLRFKMRSTSPATAKCLIYSIKANSSLFNWRGFSSQHKVGTEWKEFVYRFTTGPKDWNGYFYHIDIR